MLGIRPRKTDFAWVRGGGGEAILLRRRGGEIFDDIDGDDDDNNLLDTSDDDTIRGFAGNDVIVVRRGIDIVEGGEGGDRLVLSWAPATGAITALGGPTEDPLGGWSGQIVAAHPAGHRRVTYSSIEHFTILGGAGNDQITTADGNDVFNGGGGNDSFSGGAGNDSFTASAGTDTFAGGPGDDTYDLSTDDASADQIVEAIGEGNDLVIVDTDYTLAAGVEVETIRLTGNTFVLFVAGNEFGQTIEGMAAEQNFLDGLGGDDTLIGGADADFLDGGAGDDVMIGGPGGDSYEVDSAQDSVVESVGGGGFDSINTSVSYVLAAGSEVEDLGPVSVGASTPMDLTGNEFGQRLVGNAAANILRGEGGNDTFDGFGGADQMYGGTGDDLYFVTDAGDVVIEADGEGNDRVTAQVSYVLAANASVERLESVISPFFTTPIDLTGSSIANEIRGNVNVNILRGEGGNDALYGLDGNDFLVGGTGSDIMVGGTGDDTYYFDQTSDAISEFAGQGFDRLATNITLALAADADIERLDVEDLTSTNAIDLTGSGIANVIYGNDGGNILRGEAGNDELRGFGGNDFLVGGTGTDLMVGGAGDDTFYVDDASDAIGEIVGEGNDRIAASVSFVLSNGANVELLEAVNLLATTAFDLTGSDSNNTITGNNGVNILRGEGGNDVLSSAGGDDFLVGGASVDNMTGGAGDDTYYVDDAADAVFEIAGEGASDRVAASASYALSANADVERLEAGTQAATDPLNLTGSSIANLILGNDGANIIDGKGGADTLTGFGGADSFWFTTALGAGNVDTIVGFITGSDRILLENATFTGLANGALAPNAFQIGGQAEDADDRIVYDSATGQLFFDADGNGAGAQVQFALLQGAPLLFASDFLVT